MFGMISAGISTGIINSSGFNVMIIQLSDIIH